MKTLGLNRSKKYSEKVTHVLVSSKSNKDLDQLPEKVHWDWITEAQLINYMDELQPNYLQEENADKNLEQVTNLIMTFDENNMALAVELVDGGGLAPELITPLYIVYKFSTEATTRKKAQKLLKEKASVGLQRVLRNRKQFREGRSYWGEGKKDELLSRLEDVCLDSGIDLGVLAYASLKINKFGYSFALEHCSKDVKLELIANLITENNGRFEIYNNYETFLKFPIELCSFSGLTGIQLRVNTGYWDTEKNNFFRNELFEIPEGISKLQNLESIEVISYYFRKLPIQALAKLPKLKMISVNVTSGFDTKSLEEALPKCELRIFKR